jgi:hypothetical protein
MQRGPSRQQKKDNAAACLCFLNYLAFLRPASDRAVSILLWVASRGRSYGFLWTDSISQNYLRKDDPTPAYSPVSDRRRLTALVEIHLARRVQAPMPQISGPNLQENHIIEPHRKPLRGEYRWMKFLTRIYICALSRTFNDEGLS